MDLDVTYGRVGKSASVIWFQCVVALQLSFKLKNQFLKQ